MFISKKKLDETIAEAVAKREQEIYFMERIGKLEERVRELENRLCGVEAPGVIQEDPKSIGY